MSQIRDLHRALLRPPLLQTLRAAGFHTTKPSVLDTLVSLTENYLLLLASTTARHAHLSHNTSQPTVTDVRMALQECGALIPVMGAAEEEWRERMRRPLSEVEGDAGTGGRVRLGAEKRKREEEDRRDVRRFEGWVDGAVNAEVRRVAGLVPDTTTSGAIPVVGVGGGVVQAEDFLTVLKKKHSKTGDDSRLVGTALGRPAEDKDVLVEGGPVQSVREWRPWLQERSANVQAQEQASSEEARVEEGDLSTSTLTEGDTSSSTLTKGTLDHEDMAVEAEAARS